MSADIFPLDAGGEYEYRVVAQSPAGLVEGPWRYFRMAGIINSTTFNFLSRPQILVDGSTVRVNVTAPYSWIRNCLSSLRPTYDFTRPRCGSSSAAKRVVLAKVLRRRARVGMLTLKLKPNLTARKLLKRMLKKRRHGALPGLIVETIVTPPRDAGGRGGYRQKQALSIKF
jgi:hypothetical protein